MSVPRCGRGCKKEGKSGDGLQLCRCSLPSTTFSPCGLCVALMVTSRVPAMATGVLVKATFRAHDIPCFWFFFVGSLFVTTVALPSFPRGEDDLHVVFSTDCTNYQAWQAVVLFHSAILSGHTGPITQLVGCIDSRLFLLVGVSMMYRWFYRTKKTKHAF